MDKLAKSLAGHDKDHIYAVVREDGSGIYLADGRGRTLDRPKRKNPRHVQIIRHLPEEVAQALGSAADDSSLVHVMRLYDHSTKNLRER